ncbi:MAG: transpeptidase family protein [Acidobacteria bacterium]|nr:transpeptidase family protein [Acidobacteriota bacterium]
MRIPGLPHGFRAQRASLDPLVTTERPSDAYESAWRAHLKRRLLVVLGAAAVWVVGIEARLVQLQVFQHEELTQRARRNQQRSIPLEALRGDIVDRQGRLLAYSVEAESIAAAPSRIKDPAATARALCQALGDCSLREREELQARLTGDGDWALVRRSRAVSPAQVDRVRALKLPGIVTQTDTRRYYPRMELGAHVLGFVGLDNNGQGGLEYALDELIRGTDGRAFAQVDAKGQRLESRVERTPVDGATVQLTLDLYLQHIVERELKAGVEENRAEGGSALVMDPATGEILALANYPTFNPNAVGRSVPDARRNRAVQDVYEPGSTFKIVTASAALEEGVVSVDELIDTNPGVIRIGSRKPITEAAGHNYGVLTFADVIVKSSNVGAIKVGLRTGIDRLTKYVHRFGFGESIAPAYFAGQSRGIWQPAALNESGLASVSMGYQVGVTPLQMVTAVSAVANGGLLMEPHLVRAVVRDGRIEPVRPKVVRRAISSATVATLTDIMEGVVSPRGTARAASLDRYQVAGKTGTAHKLIDGAYSPTAFNASFVGFVPSRKPRFTILVVIDTPRAKGHFGGTVAAPIFKRIAEAALQLAGVPPSVDPAPPVLINASDRLLPARPVPTPMVLIASAATSSSPVMPNVIGLGAREAVRVLTRAGAAVRLHGDGLVARQTPAPGEPLGSGTWAALELTETLAGASAGLGVP